MTNWLFNSFGNSQCFIKHNCEALTTTNVLSINSGKRKKRNSKSKNNFRFLESVKWIGSTQHSELSDFCDSVDVDANDLGDLGAFITFFQ